MIEIILLIAILLFVIFWMWMLADVAITPHNSRAKRRIWLLLVGFTFFPGALIYYIFNKRRRSSK
ncbi:MAG: hypothetical protein ABIH25_05560 [Candidatus Woesearchaeota archaeon]